MASKSLPVIATKSPPLIATNNPSLAPGKSPTKGCLRVKFSLPSLSPAVTSDAEKASVFKTAATTKQARQQAWCARWLNCHSRQREAEPTKAFQLETPDERFVVPHLLGLQLFSTLKKSDITHPGAAVFFKYGVLYDVILSLAWLSHFIRHTFLAWLAQFPPRLAHSLSSSPGSLPFLACPSSILFHGMTGMPSNSPRSGWVHLSIDAGLRASCWFIAVFFLVWPHPVHPHAVLTGLLFLNCFSCRQAFAVDEACARQEQSSDLRRLGCGRPCPG